MSPLFQHHFELMRRRKQVIQVLVNILLIVVSFMLAMMLRIDNVNFFSEVRVWVVFPVMVPVSLFFFVRLRVYPPKKTARFVLTFVVDKLLLAIPGSTKVRPPEVIESLEPLSIPAKTIPEMADVISRKTKLNELWIPHALFKIPTVSVRYWLKLLPVSPQGEIMDFQWLPRNDKTLKPGSSGKSTHSRCACFFRLSITG